MRLLALSNFYPPHSLGSYELQCYQICNELIRRGHQLHILTAKPASDDNRSHASQPHVFRELELYDEEPAGEPPFHRLFRMVRTNRKIVEQHLERFAPEATMVWGMERLPTSLLEIIEKAGIPCIYAVYDFWLAEACLKDRWLSYWSCDDVNDASVMRPLLRTLRLDKWITKRAALGELETLRFDNIFFCSESLKQETMRACDLSLPDAKVIPCAVALDDIRPRRGQQNSRSFRIAYVARLNEKKDPMTAIRAIQELRHRGDERFNLDIYGRGKPEFESALHDYVRRFQLGGSISFKPLLEEQVRNSIHLYDALVFTSTYPEPFPLVHLKAMAARVPVISTITGGSQELIRDGENGLAFEAGNHHDLADKLTFLAGDPEVAQRIVNAAHADVSQHYTLTRATSRIESLLYRATGSNGALEEAAV